MADNSKTQGSQAGQSQDARGTNRGDRDMNKNLNRTDAEKSTSSDSEAGQSDAGFNKMDRAANKNERQGTNQTGGSSM